VAGFLEALEDEHGDQVAEVQAVRRRVEAAIERYRFLSQQLVERRSVGDLGDQAAIVQILDEGGLVHGVALHKTGMPGAGRQETVKPGILSEAGRHPAKLRPRGRCRAHFDFGRFFRLTVEVRLMTGDGGI
jgi:hypothetical protein